jgi:hypothetical protein
MAAVVEPYMADKHVYKGGQWNQLEIDKGYDYCSFLKSRDDMNDGY